MKYYDLTIGAEHIDELLEAIRLHNESIQRSPGDADVKATMTDLLHRVELLAAVILADEKARQAVLRYENYLTEADGG